MCVTWVIYMCDVTHPFRESSHTRESVLSHLCQQMNESCLKHTSVLSNTWMRQVTPANQSCHTYGWFMSHLRVSHVTPMVESHECVMSHVWQSSLYFANTHVIIIHVQHMNESCLKHAWVMSNTWMSQVTHANTVKKNRAPGFLASYRCNFVKTWNQCILAKNCPERKGNPSGANSRSPRKD